MVRCCKLLWVSFPVLFRDGFGLSSISFLQTEDATKQKEDDDRGVELANKSNDGNSQPNESKDPQQDNNSDGSSDDENDDGSSKQPSESKDPQQDDTQRDPQQDDSSDGGNSEDENKSENGSDVSSDKNIVSTSSENKILLQEKFANLFGIAIPLPEDTVDSNESLDYKRSHLFLPFKGARVTITKEGVLKDKSCMVVKLPILDLDNIEQSRENGKYLLHVLENGDSDYDGNDILVRRNDFELDFKIEKENTDFYLKRFGKIDNGPWVLSEVHTEDITSKYGIEKKGSTKAWGIHVDPETLRLEKIDEGSWAARWFDNLEHYVGWYLVKLNGVPVSTKKELKHVHRSRKLGGKLVTFTFEKEGKYREIPSLEYPSTQIPGHGVDTAQIIILDSFPEQHKNLQLGATVRLSGTNIKSPFLDDDDETCDELQGLTAYTIWQDEEKYNNAWFLVIDKNQDSMTDECRELLEKIDYKNDQDLVISDNKLLALLEEDVYGIVFNEENLELISLPGLADGWTVINIPSADEKSNENYLAKAPISFLSVIEAESDRNKELKMLQEEIKRLNTHVKRMPKHSDGKMVDINSFEHGATLTVLYALAKECHREDVAHKPKRTVRQEKSALVRTAPFAAIPIALQIGMLLLLRQIVFDSKKYLEPDDELIPQPQYVIAALMIFIYDQFVFFMGPSLRCLFAVMHTDFARHPSHPLTAKGIAWTLYLADLGVGLVTLFLGLQFLIYSPTRAELLLNAVALHFILEIDDYVAKLSDLITPAETQQVPVKVVLGFEKLMQDDEVPFSNVNLSLKDFGLYGYNSHWKVGYIARTFTKYLIVFTPMLPAVLALCSYYGINGFDDNAVKSIVFVIFGSILWLAWPWIEMGCYKCTRSCTKFCDQCCTQRFENWDERDERIEKEQQEQRNPVANPIQQQNLTRV
eukprot:gene903-407_t